MIEAFSTMTARVSSLAFERTQQLPPQKPSLESIEKNYQVKQEATETWSPKAYGIIPVGKVGGSATLTKTEGKLLDQLTAERGIIGLSKFSNIRDEAFTEADKRSPPPRLIPSHVEARINNMPPEQQAEARKLWPTNDGHNDAFRHAYWNARLTQQFGEEWAKQFATAHEGNNGGSSTREAMDLYNNEVGRKIAKEHPNASPAETADLVKKALDNGDLVVIGPNGHLRWSNEVPVGGHGVSIKLDTPDRINTPKGNAHTAGS